MRQFAVRWIVGLSMLALAGTWDVASGQQAEAEAPPVRLSLQAALEQALERNLDIAVARIAPRSQEQNVVINQAVFDHYIESSLSHSEREEEPTSSFSLLSSTVDQASVSYVDPLLIGGQWTAEVSHRDVSQEFPPDPQGVFDLVPDTFTSSVTLSYSQPLLRNFGLSINKTAINQAKNSLQISEAQFEDRVMDIVQQVEAAYWSLVGSIRQRQVAERSLELAEDFLRQTRIKVDVGTLPPIEITTAEAELASRQEGLIVAENNVRNREDELQALLRVPKDSPAWDRPIEPLDRPTMVRVELDTKEAVEEALERRFPVRQAKLEMENAELAERFRRNQLEWDLRVNANYTTTGNSFEFVPTTTTGQVLDFFGPDGQFLTGDEQVVTVEREELAREDGTRGDSFAEITDFDNTNWSVGFSLTIPLGNRDARARHVQSRLALEESALRLDQARQALRVEVRSAVREVETALRRVESARANVELQRKVMEAERKRYENGLSTSFRVLEFQRDFLQAQSNEINALIDYNQALAALSRVKGTLLDDRSISLND
jgi:outer membrane protein TolC